MSRPPTRRTFLSPADALEARTRLSAADCRDVSPEMLRLLSSSSASPAKPSPTPLPSYRPSSREFWQVISEEEHESRGGRPVKAGHRRFSSQDVKTPSSARTSLLPNPRKHKSTASEPILSSGCLPSVLSSSLRSLYEETKEMDPPRLHSRRPASPTSSVTTRSSFESRHKSPLSISSSVDYDSSRTSEDSAYSNSNGKRDFLASRSPIPPTPAPSGKRMVTEPIVPMFSRYGAGGEGRQQIQQTTLVIPPKLGKGPPSPTSPRRRAYAPRILGDGFKKLPEEILLVVLAELKKLHLDIGSLSCPTCWMRDLINLGLSCKKWWRASRIALYEDVQLTGCDSVLHTKKKFKIKYGTRLTLLRRTLRARPDYAEYTKSLKVPAMPEAAKSKKEQDEYLDLVASIIMACPNLERLPGFYPTYNHEFSRFVNALSTRTKLVERVWVINPSAFQRQHRFKLSENSQDIIPMLAPGPLMPEQCIDLITYHRNWNNLQTLVVHCNPGGTVDSALFTDIFWSLPTLENLHISGFPAPAFNDSTLLALPPLKSLRLENLPGITDDGLSSYAAPRRADALTSLTLISIPLVSLQVLSRLFSHLKSLTHFTISQVYPPTLPDAGEIFLHPYLANRNLQYLHWEFANADDDQATEIMAKSIMFHGFPSLRTIRAPTDHEGSLQRLCRPRERIELPADRYRNMALSRRPSPQRSQTVPNMPSPTRSTFSLGHGPNGSISSNYVKSPTRSTFSLNLEHSSRTSNDSNYRDKSMSLATARRNAQQRIDVASTQPQFHIIIWDEFGLFVERFAVGGFIGTIQSKISYSLKPDVDSSDEAIFGMEALLDGGEEVTPKDGCTGNWNLLAGVYEKPEKGKSSNEKKGKDRWWHTERGRWRELPLEKLF